MSQPPPSDRPRAVRTSSDANGACHPLIQVLVEVLEQGRVLAASLDPAVFAAAPGKLSVAGAGPHLRHALDFCRRFLEGVEDGRIDYDRRQRDPLEESDPRVAARRVAELQLRLRRVGELDPAQAVRVRHDLPAERIREANGDGNEWTDSSLGRELLFVISHTIHHYALMALILRVHGIDPGPEFGVAPSTLRYWHEAGHVGQGAALAVGAKT